MVFQGDKILRNQILNLKQISLLAISSTQMITELEVIDHTLEVPLV